MHKKSIDQAKVIRIAINLIEDLVAYKKLLIEKANGNFKLFNGLYERLTKKSKELNETKEEEEQPEMVEALTGEYTSLEIETPNEIINQENN